jgi:hypothetical protein
MSRVIRAGWPHSYYRARRSLHLLTTGIGRHDPEILESANYFRLLVHSGPYQTSRLTSSGGTELRGAKRFWPRQWPHDRGLGPPCYRSSEKLGDVGEQDHVRAIWCRRQEAAPATSASQREGPSGYSDSAMTVSFGITALRATSSITRTSPAIMTQDVARWGSGGGG